MRGRKDTMKQTIGIVMAFCLLLSGCGVIRDQKMAGDQVPVSVLDLSGLDDYGRVEKSAVYFLNETSGTLMAELRTLVISQDINPAASAVQELIKGTSNDSLSSVAPEGMALDFLEYSKSVANVYLSYHGNALQPKQAYILEQAIANTVTDILGATSVCVFYNGTRAGLAGYPSAPLKKQTGSIEDAWLNAYSKFVPEAAVPEQGEAGDTQTDDVTDAEDENKPRTNEISTVLYFVAAGGGYILPEVRTIKYSDDNFIEGLLLELKNGPRDTAAMRSPLIADIELAQPPTYIDAGNGKRILELSFSRTPVQVGISNLSGELLSYAALIYTITGFVPNIKSVDVYVSGKRIITIDEEHWFFDGMERTDFFGYIASSAPVYFADQSSDLLLEVPRNMEQGKTWSARERVLEVLNGPHEGDGDNVWPVMPAGVTADDIKSVDVYNDIAYVDFSQRFMDACAGLSGKNEMLLVYSVVNTITAMDGIKRVQFTVEGQQIDKLTGYLSMSDPFLRNYGIIKRG